MQPETFFPLHYLLCVILGAAYLLSQELCGEIEENQRGDGLQCCQSLF